MLVLTKSNRSIGGSLDETGLTIYNHPMLIYQGVKAQDMDALVVWTTDRGDTIASRGWSLIEAIDATYRNLVDAAHLKGAENPELEATLAITQALETGVKLMRIGFDPTPEMVEEISLNLGVEKYRVKSDEQIVIQD